MGDGDFFIQAALAAQRPFTWDLIFPNLGFFCYYFVSHNVPGGGPPVKRLQPLALDTHVCLVCCQVAAQTKIIGQIVTRKLALNEFEVPTMSTSQWTSRQINPTLRTDRLSFARVIHKLCAATLRKFLFYSYFMLCSRFRAVHFIAFFLKILEYFSRSFPGLCTQ